MKIETLLLYHTIFDIKYLNALYVTHMDPLNWQVNFQAVQPPLVSATLLEILVFALLKNWGCSLPAYEAVRPQSLSGM